MVCLGNICRSPMAQGILEQKIEKYHLQSWEVDSAGTSGWHDGEAPDNRAIATSMKHGIDISKQISRRITKDDFEYFDLILAMDASNYQDVKSMCLDSQYHHKIKMLMNFRYPDRNMAVPDPYYDGKFSQVFDLLDDGLDYLIKPYQ